MARQNSPFTFIGRFGNMIGYMRNGKPCVRSVPEKITQSEGSRRSSKGFGMASAKGALIRNAFRAELDICPDGAYVNRLNKALIPSQGENIENITGFRFKQDTGIDRFLTKTPELSGDGVLHIPPQTLSVFKGIDALEIKVIAIRFNLTKCKVAGTEKGVLIINARESFNGAAFSVDVPGKGTLVVALQVRGMKKSIPSHNTRYLAADIVAVQPPLQKPKASKKQA